MRGRRGLGRRPRIDHNGLIIPAETQDVYRILRKRGDSPMSRSEILKLIMSSLGCGRFKAHRIFRQLIEFGLIVDDGGGYYHPAQLQVRRINLAKESVKVKLYEYLRKRYRMNPLQAARWVCEFWEG
jgi:hypothetical protein